MSNIISKIAEYIVNINPAILLCIALAIGAALDYKEVRHNKIKNTQNVERIEDSQKEFPSKHIIKHILIGCAIVFLIIVLGLIVVFFSAVSNSK